ncbi:MAG: N-6 DNA methylase [Muribaculaceae bacterium]|nr:N-6 DNA methylase [Muribaculaceae bacterium]
MPRISKATEYNWKKLNSDTSQKLTRRANKTRSERKVVASGYLDFAPANQLLRNVSAVGAPVGDIIYSLCVSALRFHNIDRKKNVAEFMSQFNSYKLIELEIPELVWTGNNDVLGFIYQSLITEGERNLTGQYYTNKKVVDYMLNNKILANGETFLDPCCGSGAFLLSVRTNTPECLYGFDINPLAVMIAGTNLLIKYAVHDFIPHLYCLDFLKRDLFNFEGRDIPFRFDNIYTNPPWGADKEGIYNGNYPEIKSNERCSMVIVESLRRLNTNGSLYFLLPASLLKIKTHADIRKHILTNSKIERLDLYSDRFDGVFTDYFSIKLSASPANGQRYAVTTGSETITVSMTQADINAATIAVQKLTQLDDSIIRKMESKRHDDLKHSRWALGIVTGDNKNKVKTVSAKGLEPVYTGKQVQPFRLHNECSYILFEPDSFQQCAKEEYFRAPEKLIYRFIAKYPIVAYDDKQRLCLNSANILIPQLDGISIKSVAALLNSSLYHYYYSLKFTDIKVLKGNLQELPFPKLTPDQDRTLSNLVSSIHLSGLSEENQQKLDETIYSIFDITPAEQQQIKSKTHGNPDKRNRSIQKKTAC